MRSIHLILIFILAWQARPTVSSQEPQRVPKLPPNYCIWDGLLAQGNSDVCIGKRLAAPAPFVRGEQVGYSLVISNTTLLASSTPITVTDMLPQGLQFFSIVVPLPWRCMNTAAVVRCVRNTPLPARTQETLTLSATIQMTAPAIMINCATVAMPNDSDPSNNESCVETQVIWPHRVFAVPMLRASSGSQPGTP